MLKFLFPFSWLHQGRFDIARDGLGACGLGTWAAIVVGVVGVGAGLYGANKQSKDSAGARDMNLGAQQESERQNWMRYLMTRGITPSEQTQTGVVPGHAPGGAINTKLPLWARVVVPNTPQTPNRNVPFLIKKG